MWKWNNFYSPASVASVSIYRLTHMSNLQDQIGNEACSGSQRIAFIPKHLLHSMPLN